MVDQQKYLFFFKSVILSYSQIFFSYKIWFGVLIAIITFFNWQIGVGGLLSVIVANLTAIYLGYNRDHIEKGYYGFNPLLIGLEITYFFKPNLQYFVLLIVAAIFTVLLTAVLNKIFYLYFGIPSLTFPFVLMSIILYFATYNYIGLTLQDPKVMIFDTIEIYEPIALFFQALSIIFFQTTIWVGVIISIILIFYSPIFFLLSFISFVVGISFYTFMGGAILGVENAFVGFNFIFTGVAIGGIFFVPSIYSYLLAILGVIVTALIGSAIKTFVIFYGMPVFALPFNIAIFIFLISFRDRGKDKKPKMVDFVPGKPEDNLNFYLTNIKRFGKFGIEHQLSLPIRGKWKISQGVDGEYTHKDRWRWALDFQMITYSGEIFENEGKYCEDYPTFKSSVYSPADGVVVAIENSIDDNNIGEVNTLHNWGNYVIIKVGYGVYIKMAHFLKNSIELQLNQTIKNGDYIGKVGNSGRSSYPHLHFQIQQLPIVGSTTIPFSFSSYILLKDDQESIEIDKIPNKDDIIESIESDSYLSSFALLYVGRELCYKQGEKEEIIKSDIDLYGKQYLISENGAKLYFSSDKNYLYFLDYEGDRNSILFQFYQYIPRVPLFYRENLSWSETLYIKEGGIKRLIKGVAYSIFSPKGKIRKLRYGKKGKAIGKIGYTIKFDDGKIWIDPENFILKFKVGDNVIEQRLEC